MDEQLVILHTNDIHSHLENWPRLRRFLKTQKHAYEQAGATVLTLDIGDAMDRVHPLTEATNGQANVTLLNQVDYDGVTIGNNEGLGNTKEQLDHLYDEAHFDVILGNLLDAKTGSLPDWAISHKFVKTAAGTRILLLGLTAPYSMTYPLVGFQPVEVEVALDQLLATYAGQYDCLILLSHLGLDVDRRIANHYPQFDLIVGAHTHHLLIEGEQVNQTMLAAAGKYGQYVGTVEMNLADHHSVAVTARVTKTATLAEKAEDRAEIDRYEQRGETLLDRQLVAALPHALNGSWESNSPLMVQGLASLKEDAGTDAAILNGGLFLTDLPRGIVTRKDIHELLPHAMHVMKVTLTGADLYRLIREMEKNRQFLMRFPIKGMGFRGQLFGALCYDGISYNPHNRVVSWHGEPLVAKQQYTVAMPDHYLFIPFFPTIEIAGQNTILYDKLLRTVFGDYLAKHDPIREADNFG